MTVYEYIYLRPKQLEEAIKESPVAWVPMGALEWHSYHLPLGMDGIKAEALIKKAADKFGGVLFPCRYWGSNTTMKFPYTHRIPTKGQLRFIKSTIKILYNMGFKVIILLSGHYPNNLVSWLKKASLGFMDKHPDAYVFGAPEYVLLGDKGYFGDHAAMWETDLLMALYPDLVDLKELPENLPYAERIRSLGIMGKDPRIHSSKEKGQELVNTYVDRLVELVQKSWDLKSQQPIRDAYDKFHNQVKSLINPRNLAPALDALGMDEKKDLVRQAKWMFIYRNKGKPIK
jgi:creatinine amidohydrolase